MFKIIVCFVISICIAADATNTEPPTTPTPDVPNCGYKSCHPIKEGFINVHLVPHTHDDVGWLKTVDQYYYGSNTKIQSAGVQYILDSVVDALRRDANRRFIYVETAFFWKWWIRQHDHVKALVRRYVRNGQLEFVGGAWSMNDEANTNYQSIIDQFTWGLRKLNDTFGECGRPKVGWQIDPFGHSKEMASIFAQLGFDGLLLGRVDYQEKSVRLDTKTAEMVWRGSHSLGTKTDLFTGIMYNVYAPPKGFCFDVLCSDDPIIDDQKSPEYNVDEKVDGFFEYINNITSYYMTSNVILTMGEDFHYQDANMWFKNLDKLIFYANQRQQNGSKYNLLYSTPSCYVKAINDETKGKVNWLLKQDDFFPYSSDPHAFWTGYFTSRPTIKRYEREGNNFLQVCKQLYALADLGPEDWVDLNVLREAMGVMQHHDAITGTEKEHVAHDYVKILSKGFEECEFITATALSKIISPEGKTRDDLAGDPTPKIPYKSCLLANISSCQISETEETFVVTVYNPLSRTASKHVRFPVLGTAYSVKDPAGNEQPVELIPIPDQVLSVPGRKSEATADLIFLASGIPPLGFKSYYVKRIEGDMILSPSDDTDHSFGDVSFKITSDTGLLAEISMNGKTLRMSQDFFYYNGFVGDNSVFENRSSGAYILRPNDTNAYNLTNYAKLKIFRGSIVSEVQQTFNEWVSQVIRIYNTENFVEFEWLVGPIPTDEPNGREIVTRFSTGLNSNSVFYTDLNGREMLKRIKDFRPTWKLDLAEPVAGNYYPITSKILLRDEEESLEVAVLIDRAQGGTSLKDGEIELMVHRNCLHDDAFGVGEPLIEEAYDRGLVARGSHYVVLGSYNNNSTSDSTIASQEKEIAQRLLLKPWTFLTKVDESFEDYKDRLDVFAGLKRDLPENVQILTLEPWKGFSFLLRLEHIFEKNEDPYLSQPVSVDLKNLFTTFEIESIRETTLGANQWLEDNDRLFFATGGSIEDLVSSNDVDKSAQEARDKWNNDTNSSVENFVKRDAEIRTIESIDDDLVITLDPMQIRTFVIEIKKSV